MVTQISKRLYLILAATTLALTVAGLSAQGGAGRLTGTIVDNVSGEAVFGVVITAAGPGGAPVVAQSDFDGRYSLSLPPGNYRITYQMIGSAPQVREVTVIAGQTVSRNIVFGLSVAQEVQVTGRAINNTEASMLALQRKSAAVSDGVSQEAIRRSPDSAASDVLRRVTGISIIGGKFVFVRGLGERYSNTVLNNVPVPSPEPDKRVVPLDLFPASLIKNIRVIKSFLPEESGDFSGGVVKIETQEFPDEFLMSVGLGLGGNHNTTSRPFKTYNGSSTDWLGKDDGFRDRPGIVDSWPEFLPFQRGDIRGGLPEALVQFSGAQFANTWDPRTIQAPFDRDLKFSIGDTVDLAGMKFGYLYGTSYNRQWRKRQSEEITLGAQNLASGVWNGPETFLLVPLIKTDVTRHTEEVLWGNNLNLSLEPVANQRIYLKNFYSRNSEKYVREGDGNVTGVFGISGDPFLFKTLNTGWIGRELTHIVLGGEHAITAFSGRPHKFSWDFSNAVAVRDEPNLTQQLWQRSPDTVDFFYRSTSNNNGYRYYSRAEDETETIQANYEIPFEQWDGLQSTFKFGAFASDRVKEFRSDLYLYTLLTGTDALEVDFVPGSVSYSLPALLSNRVRFTEQVGPVDSYDASQKVHAYFGQVDMPLMPKLRFIGGLRYEDSFQFIKTYKSTEPLAPDFDIAKTGIGILRTKDRLPSANLVWEFQEDMNLRLSYTETVNRPDFRDLSLFGFSTTFGGDLDFGNPFLKRAYIHNYDSRWEWYISPDEYLGVGVFLKDFSNPIEKVGLTPSSSTSQPTSYLNAVAGELRGAEFELRKGFLESFEFQTNLFIIRSRVEILEWTDRTVIALGLLPVSDPRARFVPTRLESELVGQSPYVWNAQVRYYFDQEKSGSVGILYNYFADRLEANGANNAPDRIEQGAGVVDITAEKSFGENLSIKGAIKNVLDTRFKITQENALLGGREEVVRSYRDGVSYSFSASYKF